MPPLEGYPKVSKEANLVDTSRKVIVARSYEELNGEGYGRDAADRNSHGTSAAAVPVEFRGLVLSGVAPMAYLGNYKVLGDDGGGTSDAILRAIDDALRDGMDVLNLSLGSDLAVDPSMDAQYKAVEAACLAGVIVVAAAGNAGPNENTINSPSTAPCAMSVGSSSNAAGDEVVFGIRVLDGAGVALAVKPAVEAGPGGGSVMAIEPAGAQFPGAYLVQVKLGAGENLFRIVAGEVRRELSITGK
jgi:hypothetical protein